MPTLTRTADTASLLRLSVMRLARRLRNERAAHTLTLTQIATLATLDRHGPMTPRELAGHERVQPPSMTRVLAHLEEQGLVSRTPHDTDGRRVVVALTPAALEILREDRRRRDVWLAQLLAELDPAERETLRSAAAILARLAES